MSSTFVVRENYSNISKLRMIITTRCHRLRKKQIVIFILIMFFAVFYISVQKMLLADYSWRLEQSQWIKEEIGTDCEIPHLDHFTRKVTEVDESMSEIICERKNWVKCYHSQCMVVDEILDNFNNIVCTYRDIIYINDNEYSFGPPTRVKDDGVYTLVKSDHVKVACTGRDRKDRHNWSYYSTGFRNSVKRGRSLPGRENTPNILMLIFDSTSRNGFIKKLPKSYEYLTKVLNGTILKGYNIVGAGTSGALFPILTGKIEYELPTYLRKDSKVNRSLDSVPFLFYKLKNDGYRTAYLEDMPWLGTFQHKFNGFRHQPTDHYLRDFFMEEAVHNGRIWASVETERFCVGDTPQYELMLSKTDQFLLLDGKRFCLTFISDLTHDKNLLSVADENIVNFLRTLMERQQFKNTLMLVMADHGPRYGNIRNTLNGRMEERLPFMCVVLPEDLKRKRLDAQVALEHNANTWTTPYDIHTTLLDALDLPQHMNMYKVPGANITRGMSLLKEIPKNRTCWEAGIEPHWCTCLSWQNVSVNDSLYQKAGDSLARYINLLTDSVRNKCALRTLKHIDWVKRQRVNRHMLAKGKGLVRIVQENYQVRIVMGPGKAIYEASMTFVHKHHRFFVEARHISRTNEYGMEPSCISGVRPHLNMFCYCKNANQTIG